MSMTPKRGSVIALAAAAALSLAACGGGEPPAPGSGDTAPDPAAVPSSWQALPAGPLSPREGTLALWTGSEVLLMGGSDAPPCPPSAECVTPDIPPLADGAAYDPAAGTWRTIADSPVPFEWAQGVVIGQTAYVWTPGNPWRPGASRAFLAYRIEEDRWEELAPPSTDPDVGYWIVAAADRLVAFTGSDEVGELPDLLYDAETAAWTELPPDPLSPSFDRWLVWSGRELVLFDHELVPNPCSDEPCLTRAAALDLETGTWRRLPDSEILFAAPWAQVGGSLVNPTLGGADGGSVNNWGRSYPYGGILDPESGEWSALPATPFEQDDSTFAAGVLTESGGSYFGYQGWLLDVTTDTWVELPPLDAEGLVTHRTVVAAGTDLLVFGGAGWDLPDWAGTLLDDAWVWSPR